MDLVELWQDENLLSDWKEQLDRDVETLRAKTNILNIRSVSGQLFCQNKNINLPDPVGFFPCCFFFEVVFFLLIG